MPGVVLRCDRSPLFKCVLDGILDKLVFGGKNYGSHSTRVFLEGRFRYLLWLLVFFFRLGKREM